MELDYLDCGCGERNECMKGKHVLGKGMDEWC